MDERFLESVVHKRAPLLARLRGYSAHVVLGRRLRPFSLWHQENLQAIESPFLAVWQTQQPSSIQIFKALYLATQICELRPFESLQASRMQPVRRKWLVFRFYFYLGLRRPGTRMLRLLIEAAKFRAYMADYCSVPIPFPNKHTKRVQSPPSAYQVELYRRFHPETSDREIWAKPPAEIAWANIASQEAHGAEISIYTQERLEADEIARRGGKTNGNGADKKRF